MMKPCVECGTPTRGSRCEAHTINRGTTAQRGYGSGHQQLRRDWNRIVQTGRAVCHRCNQPIAPDAAWDLGHNDDRTGYTGPEHAHCNRSAGGQGSKNR
jgi:hypothetical protein